ncbi:MAG: type II toxin-antitoxin system VapC family toxin [Desulfamplus sp.]|nr:type II toxin-antitoxin system VapC family toxin [Desulfamplus sp.]MBF0389197.1 type II toxin-antitoxin system VapC family toxin [Desulfamplus sp.]
MNLLLDTQALLWFILDDSRLSKKALNLILETKGFVLVSPASIWEIAIKISLGKYKLTGDFQQFWDNQFHINDLKLLPVSVAHVARIVNLPYHHRDPFDRLIIAQSLMEKIPVVSSDAMFDIYSGVDRIW